MKTIGLIGGLSWHSTVTYYQIINRYINQKLGASHSAKCIVDSVDFQFIEERLAANDLPGAAPLLCEAARRLENAGADFIIICSNTMHANFEKIQKSVSIPLLHIAELTARRLEDEGIKKIGLLGTKFTMEKPFYKEILERSGVEVIVPPEKDRLKIDEIIIYELCREKFPEESKKYFLSVIEELHKKGARGIILGCTEIDLLIKQRDTSVPLFDTTKIHAEKAAEYALEK